MSRRPDYDQRTTVLVPVLTDNDDEECVSCVALGVNATRITVNPLRVDITAAYTHDVFCLAPIVRYCPDPSDVTLRDLTASDRAQVSRYSLNDDLLMSQIDQFDPLRIVVPLDDDLRARVLHEHHDSATNGHLGRDKTYLSQSRTFY